MKKITRKVPQVIGMSMTLEEVLASLMKDRIVVYASDDNEMGFDTDDKVTVMFGGKEVAAKNIIIKALWED